MKPVVDAPVTREFRPRGTTVYPEGYSVTRHVDYTVLHLGAMIATPTEGG